MSDNLEFGEHCIAKDGAICRDALAPDGLGILCPKHMNRLRMGETIHLTKRASKEHDSKLAKLLRLHGETSIIGYEAAAPCEAASEPERPNNASSPGGGEGGNQDENGGMQSKQNAAEKGFELNLISLSVISTLVATYSALVVWVQAQVFDVPLGMALSGFSATNVAIQSIPHAVIMVLLATLLFSFMFLAGGMVSLAIVLLTRFIALAPRLVWGGVLGLDGILRLLIYAARKLRGSEPQLLQAAHSETRRAAQSIKNVAARIESLGASLFIKLKWALLRPISITFFGSRNKRRTINYRIVALALLLGLAIVFAYLNALDRDRKIVRLAHGCAEYSIASPEADIGDAATCEAVESHWILNPIDSVFAGANVPPYRWPFGSGESWSVQLTSMILD